MIPRPFWKVEYKPHALDPVYPLSGSQIPPGKDYFASYDDTHLNWTLIDYGFHNVASGGTLGQWDVSKLPDGFYDLRFVTSDGMHYYEYVVVGLTVARSRSGSGGGERNLGTPGRNLLAETDMEIPLFGYDASIARSYDSYDTLTPGDFGYGWRMQKFGVGVERVELPNVKGEYEEVYITLPDGREFFFANAPNEQSTPNWEADGYYAIHPYGMKMFRDGAHLDDYTGTGEWVELQSDDGTKYSFHWPDGQLRSVTSVEDNVVSFTPGGDTQYIEDSYQRQIKIERETANIEGVGNNITRIKKITDPTGKHWFEYNYDSVNNLVEVVERTDAPSNLTRKKWFRYGELEVDGKTVYYPIHHLTEMIVDTNGNGTKDDGDQRTTFAYDEEGRLEEVSSPAGTAELGYEEFHDNGDYLGGRQTVRDDLTGAVTTIDHDISGNATEVQDPMGLATTNEFYTEDDTSDWAIPGALKSTTDPAGNVTEYHYDSTIIDPDIPQGMAAALSESWINRSLDVMGDIARGEGPRGNFTGMISNLSEDEVRFIRDNLKNSNAVEHVLYGFNALEEAPLQQGFNTLKLYWDNMAIASSTITGLLYADDM